MLFYFYIGFSLSNSLVNLDPDLVFRDDIEKLKKKKKTPTFNITTHSRNTSERSRQEDLLFYALY